MVLRIQVWGSGIRILGLKFRIQGVMLKIWHVGACVVEQGWGMLLLLFEVQMEHSSMQASNQEGLC